MSIESKIEKWAKDPKNAKRIAAANVQKMKGSSSSNIQITEKVNLQQLIDEVIDVIYNALPRKKNGQRLSIEKEEIIASKPVVNSDGSIYVDFNFSEEAIHRESLRPDLYPEGMTNIVKLFTTGYSTRSQIKGQWKDRYGNLIEEMQVSRRKRYGNLSLSGAISIFNANHDGICHLDMDDSYFDYR